MAYCLHAQMVENDQSVIRDMAHSDICMALLLRRVEYSSVARFKYDDTSEVALGSCLVNLMVRDIFRPRTRIEQCTRPLRSSALRS